MRAFSKGSQRRTEAACEEAIHGVAKLMRSFKAVVAVDRPNTPKPGASPKRQPVKVRKLPQGAQIPQYDPFRIKSIYVEAAKVDKTHSNSSSKVWKNAEDDKATWKLIPKTAERFSHKHRLIPIDHILNDPISYLDIEVEEYEKDPKFWLFKVEDLTAKELKMREGIKKREAKLREARRLHKEKEAVALERRRWIARIPRNRPSRPFA